MSQTARIAHSNHQPLQRAAAACLLSWATLTGAAEPAAALPLKFADFYQQPVGPMGLQHSSTLLAANGHEVQLVGWMVAQEVPSSGYFLLTARPVRMSEHADGDADDLPPATLLVRLPEGQRQQAWPHQDGLITLAGLLSVGRAVEADGRVSWVQLQLH